MAAKLGKKNTEINFLDGEPDGSADQLKSPPERSEVSLRLAELLGETDERANIVRTPEEKASIADTLSREAAERLAEMNTLLARSAERYEPVTWDAVFKTDVFDEEKPSPPRLRRSPGRPDPESAKYQYGSFTFKGLVGSFQPEKGKFIRERFEADHARWVRRKRRTEAHNEMLRSEYESALAEWNSKKRLHEASLTESDAQIGKRRKLYLERDERTVAEFCGVVLKRSSYPDNFPREWEIEYDRRTRTLLMDFSLPSREMIPRTVSLEYIAEQNGFREKRLTDEDLAGIYDSLICQIPLKMIYELFTSDEADAVRCVVFNGWTETILKATGRNARPFIVTLKVLKTDLSEIDLRRVDARECLIYLNGICVPSGETLSIFSPVAA